LVSTPLLLQLGCAYVGKSQASFVMRSHGYCGSPQLH
jgi:hypothetical protein